MATAPFIKETIEWVLKDYLGTFTYANGFTRPSVSIGNTPGNVTVTGLEVIIPVFGHIEQSYPLLSPGTYSNRCWRIILIQRDEDLGNLGEAVRVLLGSRHFPVKNGSYFSQVDPTRTYHGYTFQIKDEVIE